MYGPLKENDKTCFSHKHSTAKTPKSMPTIVILLISSLPQLDSKSSWPVNTVDLLSGLIIVVTTLPSLPMLPLRIRMITSPAPSFPWWLSLNFIP